MENTTLLDAITGGLAILILIGGLLMLFTGMSAFKDTITQWVICYSSWVV
jgi:hypothetical protein